MFNVNGNHTVRGTCRKREYYIYLHLYTVTKIQLKQVLLISITCSHIDNFSLNIMCIYRVFSNVKQILGLYYM